VANRAEEIFSELIQICEQYKAEVPSNRGPWPESLKSRVFELKSLGLSFVKIAERTGIPYGTITSWKRPESFLPVAIVNEPSPTVTVRKPRKRSQRSELRTVTVITPSGYRIEGLDAQAITEFICRVEIV
jgi:hypothetical protein